MKKNEIIFQNISTFGAVLVGFFLFPSGTAGATPLEFSQVWRKIQEQAPELAAIKKKQEVTQAEIDRASLHWLPSISLTGRAFTTNDPARVLFGNLSQREISAQDFSPNFVNQPGYQNFQNVGLIFDLPIYEGGLRQNEKAISATTGQALTHEERRLALESFSEAVKLTSQIYQSQEASGRINEVQQQVVGVLNQYTIGNSSNPVGYSGILGLKGVQIRSQGLKLSFENQESSARLALAERAAISKDSLQLVPQKFRLFVAEQLPSKFERTQEEDQRAVIQAEVMKVTAATESARYRPKLGFFAQPEWNRGSRNSATAMSAGIYLQWSLFSPRDWKRSTQGNLAALGAEFESDFLLQRSKIDRSVIRGELTFLEASLNLLEESDRLLDQQMKTTVRLFRAGSIPAIQLAEVFNRRIDVIEKRMQVEQRWLEMKTRGL